ncbi:hypothetical protein DE146DRAFT_222024 [Phaeosphaeria sp. MPI-PUGE-AT-0046c]|nr:hypothetical protein DE146DRAFT_222024 [Phaeosphaeria sp. MPI-PUGE-AT-0046c]
MLCAEEEAHYLYDDYLSRRHTFRVARTSDRRYRAKRIALTPPVLGSLYLSIQMATKSPSRAQRRTCTTIVPHDRTPSRSCILATCYAHEAATWPHARWWVGKGLSSDNGFPRVACLHPHCCRYPPTPMPPSGWGLFTYLHRAILASERVHFADELVLLFNFFFFFLFIWLWALGARICIKGGQELIAISFLHGPAIKHLYTGIVTWHQSHVAFRLLLLRLVR